jgi:hypothetical protein
MENIQGFWARAWNSADRALFGATCQIVTTALAVKAKVVETAVKGYHLALSWARWVKQVLTIAYTNTVAAAATWADKAQDKFTR